MADKTISIDGPDAAFFTTDSVTLKANCGGTWTAAEKQALAWSVARGGDEFEPAGQGPELRLPLANKAAKAKWGYGCRVRVGLSPAVQATRGLAVIGIGTTPYTALTVAIAPGDITTRPLEKSKRVRSIATLGTAKFSIGLHQTYQGRLGLGMADSDQGPHYSARTFWPLFGPWAALVEATTRVEGSQTFAAVNTYDDARITFGLVQFGAHYYDANLILLLRRWLARSDAGYYFPNLRLKKVDGKDRIHDANGNLIDTASDPRNKALLDLLNPVSNAIDDAEAVLMAALVHLARHDPQTCVDQVRLAIRNFSSYLKDLKGKEIDGRPDYIAVLVCDIRNQGRASKADIEKCLRDATGRLSDARAYRALLALKGKNNAFAARVEHLAKAIQRMREQGLLGLYRYDETAGDFVQPKPPGPAVAAAPATTHGPHTRQAPGDFHGN